MGLGGVGKIVADFRGMSLRWARLKPTDTSHRTKKTKYWRRGGEKICPKRNGQGRHVSSGFRI